MGVLSNEAITRGQISGFCFLYSSNKYNCTKVPSANENQFLKTADSGGLN